MNTLAVLAVVFGGALAVVCVGAIVVGYRDGKAIPAKDPELGPDEQPATEEAIIALKLIDALNYLDRFSTI